MSAGSLKTELRADAGQFTAELNRAATVAEKEYARIQGAQKYITAQLKDIARLQKDAGAGATVGKQAESMHKFGLETAGAKRELLVLAHELSQGNYSRFGGSMLVLAERTNAMELATSGAGLAVGALAAAVLGSAAAVVAGAIEADHFAKSILLTGNAAGVTAESFGAMALTVAQSTRSTIGASRSALAELVATGRFAPEVLQDAATATAYLSKATGKTSAEVVSDLAGMTDGVAKWAEGHNKSMHFISAATYEYINQLEDAGKAQEAQRVALQAINGVYAGTAVQVGSIARAWEWVKETSSNAVEAMKQIGAGQTLGNEALNARRQIEGLQVQLRIHQADGTPEWKKGIQAQISQWFEVARTLDNSMQLADRVASAQADSAKRQEAGISGQAFVDSILKRAKAVSMEKQELDRFAASVKAVRDAGGSVAEADVRKGRAEIHKQYTDSGASQQAEEYKRLEEQVSAYNAATQQETAGQAKLSEAQQWAIHMHEQLATAGKHLTDQQRKTLAAEVGVAAAQREMADSELRIHAARMQRIVAENNEEETQRAKVANFVAAANEQAGAIDRQTMLIGLRSDEVTRANALWEQERVLQAAMVGANPDTVAALLEVSKVLRENLVGSLERARKATDAWNSSFSRGLDQGAMNFAEEVKNQAAVGAKFFADSVDRMNDSIINFAKTGKLSFKDLFANMAEEFLRNQLRMAEVKLFSDSTGGISFGNALANIGGLFVGHANGLSYVPYDNYPALLHEGEKVMSKQEASRTSTHAGVSVTFGDQVISVGAGVSKGEVAAALRQSNAAMEARIRRLSKQGLLQ